MRIFIIAGGGGHTGYGIAVAERLLELTEFSKKKLEIIFVIPRHDSWSVLRIRRRIGETDIRYVTKPRKPLEPIYKFILRTPHSIVEVVKSIKKPDLVVCTGSNHSLYPSIYARIIGKAQVICIEAIDRIVTRSKTIGYLHDLLKIPVTIHWREQREIYSDGLLVGPIFEKPIYKPWRGGYVLVISGSIGHKKLFDLLLRTSLENVVVQTGNIDPSYITSRKPSWKAFRFDPDIDFWIAGASIVIAHQGLTIAEAALAYQKPVILVYNPDLPQTSGYKDSYLLAKKLGGILINPLKTTPAILEEKIEYMKKRKPHTYNDGAKNLAYLIYKEYFT